MNTQVAVLCNYPHLFKTYVFKFGKFNEDYVFIRTINDCIGKRFNRIEYTVHWHDMENFVDVEKEVKNRIVI